MRKKMVILLLASALPSCRTSSSGSKSSGLSVGASGTRKTLYTGYHQNSRQFLHRTCIVPEVALNEKGNVKPEFLVPDAFARLNDDQVAEVAGRINSATGSPIVDINSNQEASLMFKKDMRTSQLLDAFAGGVDVNMDLAGTGNISGGAAVAFDSGSSERAVTLSYIAKLKARSIQAHSTTGVNRWRLTPYGIEVAKTVASLPSEDEKKKYVAENCGTHYLAQVDFGATFFANMKIVAAMQSDAKTISGKLDVKGMGVVSGKGDLCIDKNELAGSVTVELKAYQQGGSPVLFAQLLDGGANNTGKKGEGAGLNLQANNDDDARATSTCKTKTGNKESPKPDQKVEEGDAITKLVQCDITNINSCVEVFSNVVRYATNASQLETLVNQGEIKMSDPSKIFGRYFGDQLDDRTNNGYVVTGYEVLPYTVSDFRMANMFGDRPDTPASAGNGNGNGNDAKPSDEILPPDTALKLSVLGAIFNDYLDVWAYVRDIKRLIDQMNYRLELGTTLMNLGSDLVRIQATFRSCREDPISCDTKIADVQKELKGERSVAEYFAEAESIIQKALSLSTFEGYCSLTAQAQLRGAEMNAWRQTMARIASQLAAPSTVDGQSILTYKINVDQETEAESKGQKADHVPKIQKFCSDLYQAVIGTSILNLKDEKVIVDGKNIQEILVEPIAFFRNLQQLSIYITGANTSLANNLYQLQNLAKLEVIQSGAPLSHPYLFSKVPGLRDISLANPVVMGGNLSLLLRSLIRHPLIGRIEFKDYYNGGTMTPYDNSYVDLSVFPLLKTSGQYNKIVSSFKITNRDDLEMGVRLQNVDQYFGYKRIIGNDGKDSCQQVEVSDIKMRDWIGLGPKFPIARDINLSDSACCNLVKERCLKMARITKSGLSCDIECVN